MKKKIIIIALLIIISFFIAPIFINKKLDETLQIQNPKQKLEYAGKFEKVDYKVEGNFKIYQTPQRKTLRIENLKIINGPDLFLVLSNKKTSFGNRKYQIISKLKANQGNFNVEIPQEIDPSKYQYLLIHCRAFSHTFAAAKLQKPY